MQLISAYWRQCQGRQATWNTADFGDTSGREVKYDAGGDCTDDSDERPRQTRRKLRNAYDHHQDSGGNGRRRQMGRTHPRERRYDLLERPMACLGQTDKARQFATGHLNTNAGEKADQGTAGQEICEKSEPEYPR